MAKKKKKHKSQTEMKTVKYNDINTRHMLMAPFIMIDKNEHNSDTIAISSIEKEIGKEYCKQDMPSRMEFVENQFASVFNDIAKSYTSHHEYDKNLNIFNESAAINTSADILDFTSFEDTSAEEKKA